MKLSKRYTMNHVRNPEVGDMFSEMCSFWVIVISVMENDLVVSWGDEIIKIKKDDFIKRMCYRHHNDRSWLQYHGKCKPCNFELLKKRDKEATEWPTKEEKNF